MGVIFLLLLAAALLLALGLAVEGHDRLAWIALGSIISVLGLLSIITGLYMGMVSDDILSGAVLGAIGMGAFGFTAILIAAVNRDQTT
ncbi:MAG: hypothetical protein AAGK78_12695 [Planctomycetota bacterium]